MYVYIYIYTYIHTYVEREREREREILLRGGDPYARGLHLAPQPR